MNKRLILNEIKKYYGFKTDLAFAEFLGIKPTTLSNWYVRNSIDYDLITEKCSEIDANWLHSGKGNMLKNGHSTMQPVVYNNKIINNGSDSGLRKNDKSTVCDIENSMISTLQKEVEVLKQKVLLLTNSNESLQRESEALRKVISLLENR